MSRPYAGIIIAGGIAAVMGFAVALTIFGPELITKRSLTDIAEPTRLKPLDLTEQAAALAGPGLRYEAMHFDGVKADGTVDLTASYEPEGSFYFMSAPAKNSAPLGAGEREQAQRVYVAIDRPGWHSQSQSGPQRRGKSWSWSRGLRRYDATADPEPTTELPKCSLKKLWDDAITRGIPKDAVARISHDHEGYELRINGTDLPVIEFNHDCTPR